MYKFDDDFDFCSLDGGYEKVWRQFWVRLKYFFYHELNRPDFLKSSEDNCVSSITFYEALPIIVLGKFMGEMIGELWGDLTGERRYIFSFTSLIDNFIKSSFLKTIWENKL